MYQMGYPDVHVSYHEHHSGSGGMWQAYPPILYMWNRIIKLTNENILLRSIFETMKNWSHCRVDLMKSAEFPKTNAFNALRLSPTLTRVGSC